MTPDNLCMAFKVPVAKVPVAKVESTGGQSTGVQSTANCTCSRTLATVPRTEVNRIKMYKEIGFNHQSEVGMAMPLHITITASAN